MSGKQIFNGPASFRMQVHVTNDATEQSGKVTISLGHCEYPTPADIAARITKFETEELTGALAGFRLMTKKETFDVLTYEATGQCFALPGGEEWDQITEGVNQR